MSETVEAVVTHEFDSPADKVFECWLRPDAIRQWMTTALQAMDLPGELGVVEVEARVGGQFCFSDKRPMGEAFHWGTYKALDFPTTIAFTWNAGLSRDESDDEESLVNIAMTPTDEGCHVRLVHTMDAEWKDFVPQTEKGWSNMLMHIEKLLG
ncbi:MAG: SRPBCC domain-containing protein [Planctomycetales bacterium]|nr:SRPBCC domain-containing protein [Planctomycetales bacterium]